MYHHRGWKDVTKFTDGGDLAHMPGRAVANAEYSGSAQRFVSPSRNGLLGSERKHSQFDRETMSTNKIVCQLCAEFIPTTRATEQNHRLTVG